MTIKMEKFSSGYYFTEMFVETGKDIPSVNEEIYRDLQYEIIKPGDDIKDIIFQIDGTWFAVEPSRDIPSDTVSVPEKVIENTRIKHPPSRREILIPEIWFYEYLKEPEIGRSEAL